MVQADGPPIAIVVDKRAKRGSMVSPKSSRKCLPHSNSAMAAAALLRASVLLLVVAASAASAASAEDAKAATPAPHRVEFKHHNNTELAAVLQQVSSKPRLPNFPRFPMEKKIFFKKKLLVSGCSIL